VIREGYVVYCVFNQSDVGDILSFSGWITCLVVECSVA